MTEITSTVEKDLMYGIPYKFRCRWFGKYDEEFGGTTPIALNKSESDLISYDGLSYKKQEWRILNASTVGPLTVSENVTSYGADMGSYILPNDTCIETFIVSGFDANKKMLTDYTFQITPEQFDAGFSMMFHVKTGSSLSNQWILSNNLSWDTGVSLTINNDTGNKFWLRIANSDASIAWIFNAQSSLSTNTEYWLRLRKGSGNVDVYFELSTNGSDWTTEDQKPITLSSTLTTAGTLTLGGLSTQSDYFRGSIYMHDCYIKIGSSVVWKGYISQGVVLNFSDTVLPWKWDYRNEVFPFWACDTYTPPYEYNTSFSSPYYYSSMPNGTIAGTLMITPDKIMKNISKTAYLTANKKLLPGSNPWYLILKVKTGSDVSSQHYLFGSSTNYYKTVGGELNAQGKFGVGITSNGSSWDIGWMNTTTVVSANTWYWIKVSFTGTEYRLELSTDGTNWNLEKSIQSSTPIYQSSSDSTMYIGTMGSKATYWNGEIDLKECYWWGGVENVSISTSWYAYDSYSCHKCIEGDIDPDNEYYCYVVDGNDRIVLKKKTGNTVIINNTTPRYLGEVDTSVYGYYQVGVGDPNTPV